MSRWPQSVSSHRRACRPRILFRGKWRCLPIAAIAILALSQRAFTQDVFQLPAGQTSLELVTIGDVGNAPDTRFGGSVGGVNYGYSIGKFDVTVAQYTAFLNAVARTDAYSLYNASMAPGAFACGIVQSGVSGSYSYSFAAGAANTPVNNVSWGDAARFCNWLSNGMPQTGVQNTATTENGSYTLNGATGAAALLAVSRNASATYVIPTESEWYKAAYYKGNGLNSGYWTYPTASDTAPSNLLSSTGTNNANYKTTVYSDPVNYLTPVGAYAGSPSPYGAYDLGGNVLQWTDTQWTDPTTSDTWQILRGGDFRDGVNLLRADTASYDTPDDPWDPAFGFRIGEISPVPEPGTWTLAASGAAFAGVWAWRRKKHRAGKPR